MLKQLANPDQTLEECGLCGGWFPVFGLHWCPEDTSLLHFCLVDLRWLKHPCDCCDEATDGHSAGNCASQQTMSDDPRDIAPLTPLQDAIDQIGSHGDGLEFDVGKDSQGHVGASVEASKEIGKGWTASAAVQWLKDTGYAAVGKLTWRPKA